MSLPRTLPEGVPELSSPNFERSSME
eukprot:COSAG02_NODE_37270_length_444_cov_0.730435_1_plen_25_part_10